ncbi:hypothetical protein BJ165DRAFT_1458032 [Panaeolus papilionaceus]|nr:hypothetical protein BJ165DRAFT_1458032 [Panaeolus papilionaceus]
MLDPDAPSNETPYWRSFRHFFASDFYVNKNSDNVLGGGVVEVTLTNRTETLSRYIKPLPAVGTGNHR